MIEKDVENQVMKEQFGLEPNEELIAVYNGIAESLIFKVQTNELEEDLTQYLNIVLHRDDSGHVNDKLLYKGEDAIKANTVFMQALISISTNVIQEQTRGE